MIIFQNVKFMTLNDKIIVECIKLIESETVYSIAEKSLDLFIEHGVSLDLSWDLACDMVYTLQYLNSEYYKTLDKMEVRHEK